MTMTQKPKSNSAAPMVMYIIAAAAYAISTAANIAYNQSMFSYFGQTINTEFILWRVIWSMPYLLLVIHGVLYKVKNVNLLFPIAFIVELITPVYYFIQTVGYGFTWDTANLLITILLLTPVVIDGFVKTSSRALSKIPLIFYLILQLSLPLIELIARRRYGLEEQFIFALFGMYGYSDSPYYILWQLFGVIATIFMVIGSLVYLGKVSADKEEASEQPPYQAPYQPQAPYQQPYQAPYQPQTPYQQPYQAPYQPQAPYQQPYQAPYQPQAPYQQPYQAPYQQPYQAPNQPQQPQQPAEAVQNTDQPQ